MSEVREVRCSSGRIGFLLAPEPKSKHGRASAGQLDFDRKLRAAMELEHALKAAVTAAVSAQRFAAKKGLKGLDFDGDCVWRMAESLLQTEDTDCIGSDHLHTEEEEEDPWLGVPGGADGPTWRTDEDDPEGEEDCGRRAA